MCCVRSGHQIYFWLDVWAGQSSLKDLFPSLYALSLNKEAKIVDMGSWNNGLWTWEWHWKHDLFIWERELLVDMCHLIGSGPIKETGEDGIILHLS